MTKGKKKVVKSKDFEIVNDDKYNGVYLQFHLQFFASGLASKLGIQKSMTLLTIASFMNKDGECFPSQRKLAERMGVNKNTVTTYVNELSETIVNGEYIINRQKNVNEVTGFIYTYYIINTKLVPLSIFNGKGKLENKKLAEERKRAEKIKPITGEDYPNLSDSDFF